MKRVYLQFLYHFFYVQCLPIKLKDGGVWYHTEGLYGAIRLQE